MEKKVYNQDLGPVGPFGSFREAVAVVLRALQETLGLGLWLMTRTEGEDWIVLNAEDQSYGVTAGDVFPWSDSFCSRMVQGLGPGVAPDSAKIPAYREAPIGQQIKIGAYVGVPLNRPDGSLFGTLCAIDPEPQPATIESHFPTVVVYARLLATILNSELERQEQSRRAERAEAASEKDALTGLYNRRGWMRLRDAEEQRCQRYGHPAGVVLVDVDGLKRVNDTLGHAAGDRLLERTARALQAATRKTDVVARIGGDEFAVLAPEERPLALRRLEERLKGALRRAEVEASVGSASREPTSDLAAAQRLADEQMYRRKKAVAPPERRRALSD